MDHAVDHVRGGGVDGKGGGWGPIAGASEEPKLTRVLSIAPALAETIRRIHNGESVSVLFDPTA